MKIKSLNLPSSPFAYRLILEGDEELKQIRKDLTKIVIDCYEPEATRWHRNYTDRAEWHYIWAQEKNCQ